MLVADSAAVVGEPELGGKSSGDLSDFRTRLLRALEGYLS